ncbi:Polysaccharide deacetylase [Minicystis rosea]|nr:Polysaccharide deacetylase [Minicystis rosea]
MTTLSLSFDNGPDPDVTPRVLDVLARRGVRASFFVLGSKLETSAGKRLAERAVSEGHWLGNHSYSHVTPLGEDDDGAVEREIVATDRLVAPFAVGPRLFRPFGRGGKIGPHLLSPAALGHLTAHAYSCVLWNVVPEDWIDHEAWVARALDGAQREAEALVVLHDIVGPAMDHLDRFLGLVADAGIAIVQPFPERCVPVREGVVVADVSGIVAA